MPTLLLIRHGYNDFLKKNKMPGRQPGIPLNEQGRKEAAELARTLGEQPIKAIYASPLERAVETATPLAKKLGLEIQLRPELMDIDVGTWLNRSWTGLQKLKCWKTVQEHPSQFRFPGGETFTEAQQRTVAALEAIAAAHQKDELVAVVFHADPIKLAVAHYIGLPLDEFQKLSAHTGSVTILRREGSSARLLGLNLIPPFTFPKM